MVGTGAYLVRLWWDKKIITKKKKKKKITESDEFDCDFGELFH